MLPGTLSYKQACKKWHYASGLAESRIRKYFFTGLCHKIPVEWNSEIHLISAWTVY